MENEKKTTLTKGKKISIIVAIVLAIILSFTCGYFSHYVFLPDKSTTANELIRLIEDVSYILDENGNPREFTADEYANAIANGLLDKYSTYYTAEEYQKIQSEGKGNQSGYGFYLYDAEHAPVIKEVVGNSPADRAGIREGDYVNSCKIEGEEKVVFLTTEDLTDYFENVNENEVVTFEIIRNGQTLNFSIRKENYKTSYVTYYDNERKVSLFLTDGQFIPNEFVEEKLDVLDENTALIKLTLFEGDVAMQFRVALNYMQQKGRTKLILDLRGNLGGYLDILCDVASDLIYNGNQKTLIAYSKGKTDSESFYMNTARKHDFITDIAVLANRKTASASECLIGAMLHYGEKFSIDRLIVEKEGDGIARTYGKGIMQTTYLLKSGGAFKLTTAKVMWPDKNTCIHEKGILPSSQNATNAGLSAVIRAQETLNLSI